MHTLDVSFHFCTVDTLTFDAGECTICLDDMVVGKCVTIVGPSACILICFAH